MNTMEQDIEQLKQQEAALCFPAFDAEMAWRIGSRMRELAASRGQIVALDIQLNGQPLFYSAMAGTAPDHFEWLRRKRNTVKRYGKSSYLVGFELRRQNLTLTEKTGLSLTDYATHGGCLPIRLKSSDNSPGIVIGTIAVTGLPERQDHELAVEAICEALQIRYAEIALTSL